MKLSRQQLKNIKKQVRSNTEKLPSENNIESNSNSQNIRELKFRLKEINAVDRHEQKANSENKEILSKHSLKRKIKDLEKDEEYKKPTIQWNVDVGDAVSYKAGDKNTMGIAIKIHNDYTLVLTSAGKDWIMTKKLEKINEDD
jgi:hypothetical protein